MADLTGTELALAVARVMGRDKALIGLPGVVMDIDLDDWPAYEAQKWHLCWRPDTGGAAAWEVLEWVRKRSGDHKGSDIFFRYDRNSQGRRCEISTGPDHGMGTGPTDAIALCRAVVALREAG